MRIFLFHGLICKGLKTFVHRNFHDLQDFKEIARFLRLNKPINISDLQDPGMNSGTIITFDDGFANNLMAAEILAKLRIPWTIFISTGCMSRTSLIWTVELSLLLLHGNAKEIDILGRIWDLKTQESRKDLFQTIRYLMKQMPMDKVNSLMNELRSQFPAEESQRLLHEFPEFEMLTWDEVRQLSNGNVEIGSHGVNHAIHHQEQPVKIRDYELKQSKEIIGVEIGKPCQYFALPNGVYNKDSSDEISKAGYSHIFSCDQGTVQKGFSGNIYPRLASSGKLASFVKNYYWKVNS